jgi:hypothetical protein
LSVDRDSAIRAATQLLGQEYGAELRTPHGDAVVVRTDDITEYSTAWLVPFNTRSFLETGNPMTSLVPSAVLVPKDERIQAHIPPSAYPVEEYLDKVRSGEWQWLGQET